MLFSTKSKIKSEQLKLIANALNTLGTAAIVLGFLRQILVPAADVTSDWLSMVFAIGIGLMLYFVANRVLTRLPTEE